MTITYFIIFFIILVIIYLVLKKTKKRTKIKNGVNNTIIIENQNKEHQVELDDMKYYKDLESEFKKRENLYDKIVKKIRLDEPEFETDIDDDFYIPDFLIFQGDIDKQNVHDTFVQKSISNIYKKIDKNDYTDIKDTIKEIEMYDSSVKNVLDKIYSRNSFISNLDSHELNVLKNTWKKAKTNDNIKQNLILQLKDCVNEEIDDIYCPTGVVSRIVSCLEIENPQNMPKDRDSINTEVLSKFNKLYKEKDDKYKVKNEVLNDYEDNDMKNKVSDLIDSWIEYI